MAKKRIITVNLEDVSPYDFEGTLEQFRRQIDTWIEKFGEEAFLSWDPDNWLQYNDSPSPQYQIKINREETDEEYNRRIVAEDIQRSTQEERDRKEFKRLAKKLGVK